MRGEEIIFSVFQFLPRFASREENEHFFPQFHAITSVLVTVPERRVIASWRQLTLPNYRDIEHLTDFPTYAENTERSRIRRPRD